MANVELVSTDGACGVTLGGVEYLVANGRVSLPGIFVDAARPFGFRPASELPATAVEAQAPLAPPAEQELTIDDTLPIPTAEEIAAMDKGAMREFLKARGVAVAPAMGPEKLRNIVTDEAKSMADDAKAKADAEALAAAGGVGTGGKPAAQP